MKKKLTSLFKLFGLVLKVKEVWSKKRNNYITGSRNNLLISFQFSSNSQRKTFHFWAFSEIPRLRKNRVVERLLLYCSTNKKKGSVVSL